MDVKSILKNFIDYLIYYIDSFKTNIVYKINIPFIKLIDNIYHVRIITKHKIISRFPRIKMSP